jgi:dTDP-4-amino-4,6-dideoxygalactose transaminase
VLPPECDRDHFRASLEKARIQTSVHYPPIHQFTAYRQDETRSLPMTEQVAERLVTLPLYPNIDQAAVDAVTKAVVQAVADSHSAQGGDNGTR